MDEPDPYRFARSRQVRNLHATAAPNANGQHKSRDDRGQPHAMTRLARDNHVRRRGADGHDER